MIYVKEADQQISEALMRIVMVMQGLFQLFIRMGVRHEGVAQENQDS